MKTILAVLAVLCLVGVTSPVHAEEWECIYFPEGRHFCFNREKGEIKCNLTHSEFTKVAKVWARGDKKVELKSELPEPPQIWERRTPQTK
jgi:hypothetical protein